MRVPTPSKIASALLLLLGFASIVAPKPLYDPVKSHVTVLNPKNWDG